MPTNPPPQWLVEAIYDWVDKSMTGVPPEFDNPALAALITARFEQACGEDEKAPLYGDPLPKGMSDWERDIILAENVLRAEQRTAWYAGKGDKNDNVR